MKVEPNTNAVMYGHGTLQFVLDIRGLGYDSPDLSEGATDAYPVFEIAIHSEIGDEDAEGFGCEISTASLVISMLCTRLRCR